MTTTPGASSWDITAPRWQERTGITTGTRASLPLPAACWLMNIRRTVFATTATYSVNSHSASLRGFAMDGSVGAILNRSRWIGKISGESPLWRRVRPPRPAMARASGRKPYWRSPARIPEDRQRHAWVYEMDARREEGTAMQAFSEWTREQLPMFVGCCRLDAVMGPTPNER